jgi:transcription elongation factor SPT5
VKNIHLKEKKHALMPGDNVEVVGGELVNLRGKVLSIAGDKVVS